MMVTLQAEEKERTEVVARTQVAKGRTALDPFTVLGLSRALLSGTSPSWSSPEGSSASPTTW